MKRKHNQPSRKQVSELALIDSIRTRFGRVRSRTLALGMGDDCAILRPPPRCELVVTTDFSLEGRHFRRDWHSPESAGHRCLARGLSDIAAMGATPLAAFLSLALPANIDRRWVARFFDGLQALAERFNVPLAGGDTAQSPSDPILADIVLIGSAPSGRALRRSAARTGDLLYVTGALGGAAAELERMQTGRMRRVRTGTATEHPQMFPEPRFAIGKLLLQRRLATACIDVSDGLSSDLAHLCRESGVGAEVDQAALPLHPKATLGQALNGGEDYELLFTSPMTVSVPRRIAGVAITKIGRITEAAKGVELLQANGTRAALKPGGWEHFKS